MTAPKVLVLSRNYPNAVLPYLGLWVERLVCHAAPACDQRVVAPVPYCPPLPGLPDYTRFRQVPARSVGDGVPVYHPRFLVGPGTLLYGAEAWGYYLGVRGLVKRLRQEFPFDLIHAHFSYPDGVVAEWLGRQYGVPVLVTEHALWRSGMEQHGWVRRQAVAAASRITFHIAVSRQVRATIAHFTGSTDRIRVIPNGVDGGAFSLAAKGEYKSTQILYIGFLNHNKGVDVLLHALRRLGQYRPEVRLLLVGGSFYGHARSKEAELRRLAADLQLGDRATFLGPQPPAEVARLMRESALVVLPSRGESFGAVLVEALACGTPVLATRCGGPEDIVTDDVGLLVPPEDEWALAQGIEHLLRQRPRYNSRRLRAYALGRFSWERVAADTLNLYHEALAVHGSGWLGRPRGAVLAPA
jgi:glycosyltransferase involved in cell wall biosynthesis